MFLVVTYYSLVQIGFPFENWLIYLGGFIVHMLGVYVNVITSAKCGNSCPTDCPLPVPYLNHNGFCHITEMLGAPFIFYAQKTLYEAIERGDRANATTKRGCGVEGKRIPSIRHKWFSHVRR